MDAKKVRQILLLLDSEQPGEQSAALGKLRALKAQGEAVFRDVFDLFGKVAEVAEERDRLKQENVNLAARVATGRPSLWLLIKSHARTAAISAASVGVVAAGLHLSFPAVDHGGAAALRELQHRLDAALLQLAAEQHRGARPPSRPSRH